MVNVYALIERGELNRIHLTKDGVDMIIDASEWNEVLKTIRGDREVAYSSDMDGYVPMVEIRTNKKLTADPDETRISS